MHVASGMESGAGLALDRLEEVARSLVTSLPISTASSPA